MYRVMLVEDNNEIQQSYVKMKEWRECGFVIEEKATNGSQAFNILKNHELDVIFTEIKLPLMDGITLIKQVKQEYPNILFVFISSCNEFEYVREGIRLGALDYLINPMSSIELTNVLLRLKNILDSRQNERMLQKLCEVCNQEIDREDTLLIQMCKYLENHMDENVTVEEVAHELRLNKDYLGKQIKRKTGENFRTLYNKMKIEYAKEMIQNGQYRIYEISEMLGYTSSDYFTQIFKKVVKMTPAEYRKM